MSVNYHRTFNLVDELAAGQTGFEQNALAISYQAGMEFYNNREERPFMAVDDFLAIMYGMPQSPNRNPQQETIANEYTDLKRSWNAAALKPIATFDSEGLNRVGVIYGEASPLRFTVSNPHNIYLAGRITLNTYYGRVWDSSTQRSRNLDVTDDQDAFKVATITRERFAFARTLGETTVASYAVGRSEIHDEIDKLDATARQVSLGRLTRSVRWLKRPNNLGDNLVY